MAKKSTSTPIVKLDDLCKSYFLGEEEVKAVCNISLTIKPKEYVGILGTSGCGKSTLMYLIGLLEAPTSGTIIIAGQDVSRLSDDTLSRFRNEHIGFVFQSFNLITKFTVFENVLMPLKYTKTKINFNPQKRAEELLRKFNIYERKDFSPNKISGGEQQRAAIARALIMQPKIILADEPTGNLDTKTGDEILNLLDQLNRDFDTTVIVVTHDQEVADRTHRQIYMRDGQIVTKPK